MNHLANVFNYLYADQTAERPNIFQFVVLTLSKNILSFKARGKEANTDLVLFVCPNIQTDRKSIFLSFKCRVPGQVICKTKSTKITSDNSSCNEFEKFTTVARNIRKHDLDIFAF